MPGKFFSCDSFGFSCSPDADEHADDRQADPGDRRTGRRRTKRAQRPQAPSSGWPRSTKRFGITRTRLIRVPSTASIAGRSVIAASTETSGISMPPMPIERMNGSGRMIIDSRPTATVEPETITERPACVIVCDERGLDVLALAQLVAEAEDHQQRVVDRHAEADERDQELRR